MYTLLQNIIIYFYRISKATVSDYSEKIEAIDANLVSQVYVGTLREQLEQLAAEKTSEGLPRPTSTVEDRAQNIVDGTDSAPIKLDAGAQAHISKHRKLQEDLTDEMVVLARQLKESTLMMNQSIKKHYMIFEDLSNQSVHCCLWVHPIFYKVQYVLHHILLGCALPSVNVNGTKPRCLHGFTTCNHQSPREVEGKVWGFIYRKERCH